MKCPNCGNELVFRINLKGDMDEFDGKAQCLRCYRQWGVNFEALPEMTLQERFDTHYYRDLRKAYELSLQITNQKETE